MIGEDRRSQSRIAIEGARGRMPPIVIARLRKKDRAMAGQRRSNQQVAVSCNVEFLVEAAHRREQVTVKKIRIEPGRGVTQLRQIKPWIADVAKLGLGRRFALADRGEEKAAARGKPCVSARHSARDGVKNPGGIQIVRIEESDDPTCRQGKPLVHRMMIATVRLTDHAEMTVSREEIARPIGRLTVDDDVLNRRIVLRDDAFDRDLDEACPIQTRRDDCDWRPPVYRGRLGSWRHLRRPPLSSPGEGGSHLMSRGPYVSLGAFLFNSP